MGIEEKVTAATTTVAIAAVAAVPVVGPFVAAALQVGADAFGARRQREFVEELMAQMSADIVERFAEQQFEAEQMVASAFERSSQANSDRIARAMARAVAGAFSPEELGVQRGDVTVHVISSLTEAHCVALAELDRAYPDEFQPGAASVLGGPVSHTRGNLTVESLERRLPQLAGVLGGVVAALESNGLVRNVARGTYDGVLGAAAWSLTDFGTRVVRHLLEEDSSHVGET